MALTDEQIDALLAENDNLVEVATRLHERKRKRAHAKAQAAQPELGIRGGPSHAALFAKLKAMWNAPLTDDEKGAGPGDIEYLGLTVQDCADADDAEDLIFAQARLARKLLGRNAHLWRRQDIATPVSASAPVATPDGGGGAGK
jgi:hypothetical protein